MNVDADSAVARVLAGPSADAWMLEPRVTNWLRLSQTTFSRILRGFDRAVGCVYSTLEQNCTTLYAPAILRKGPPVVPGSAEQRIVRLAVGVLLAAAVFALGVFDMRSHNPACMSPRSWRVTQRSQTGIQNFARTAG